MSVILQALLLLDLSTPRTARGIALSADGNTVFVADEDSLKIIDVSNPASPSIAGQRGSGLGHVLEVTLSADGNTAFVADYTNGLQIIDVSNLASPSITGTYDTSGMTLMWSFLLMAILPLLLITMVVW